ncbi:aldose 1-epimerase family protein [Tessaracoccus sp. ZS01]|uniref:aldose 1-epimerase family protein n=1 Tax=Tessaracoccus sp. ZS01 TaxID=1906324 RepID=UPI001300E189|nr:aldose 1-epimerase family protein [Tessaracoccus sp. ZS01]
MNILPTGQQFLIESGPYTAVVTEVGSTLRSLTRDGVELLHTFPEDGSPSSSMGRQLVPWPNRIRDGRYTFNGVDQQLPISEVPRNNAIHGLGSDHAWRLVSHDPDEVVLTTVIYPQTGWDGVLEVEISHALDDGGLTVTVTARNAGQKALPYGYGTHPYLAVDTTAVLTSPFPYELAVDDRLLPVELTDVTAEHDFREPREIGSTEFDSAFRIDEGPWELTVADGTRTIAMWADATLPWCQIYVPPTRNAIAVEPMTCAADAFNEGPTHESLIVLQPGAETSSRWGIRVDAVEN